MLRRARPRGDVDIALSMASRQAPPPDDPRFHIRALRSDTLDAVLPAGHPLAGARRDPARRARGRAVRRPAGRDVLPRRDDHRLRGRRLRARPSRTARSTSTRRWRSSRAGLGVALVPRLAPGRRARRARSSARSRRPRPRATSSPRRARAPSAARPSPRCSTRCVSSRIRLSTSSRLASMSSRETRLSRHRRSSGSVLDGAHVEVPVVVVDRDAVELGDLGVGVARADLLDLRRLVGDLGVDLARDEVARAVGLEQLGERRCRSCRAARGSAARAACPSRRCRSRRSSSGRRPRRRRRRPRRACGVLKNAWPTRLTSGVPPAVAHRVGHRARGAHVVEDVRARVRLAARRGRAARQRKSPSTNSPSPSMKKQRSASPSHAMPRSAPSLRTFSITKRRFSGSSGLGSWSGNSPSGSQ